MATKNSQAESDHVDHRRIRMLTAKGASLFEEHISVWTGKLIKLRQHIDAELSVGYDNSKESLK